MAARSARRPRCAPGWLGLLLAALCSCDGPSDDSPSVVLVTIDTLRSDHLGCYGYFRDTSPTIDALAAEGLLFESVVTSMTTTLPAHTSLLTSSYPTRNGVLANYNVWKQPAPTGEGGLRSVTQLFREAGYETAAFVSVFHLGRGSGVDTGFAIHDGVAADIGGAQPEEGKKKTWKEIEKNLRNADVTTDRVLEWLESRSGSPFFLWIHYFDPHTPYTAPRAYFKRWEDEPGLERLLDERRVPDDLRRRAAESINRYDEEVRFTDDQLARLFASLKDRGLWDDALVILTADHGEGLGQQGHLDHGHLYNGQLFIPLVMKLPSGTALPGDRSPRGERISRLTSIIDVFPTAISLASLPIDTVSFDGVDVLSVEREWVLSEREHTKRRFGNDVSYTLTGPEWKYHYHSEAPDELFRIANDWQETENVIDENPDVARAMSEELGRIVQENLDRGAGLELERERPQALRDALESLGYVE